MLSPLEIRAAIKIAERENGAMSADDAAIAVTRLLGFKRTGPDLKGGNTQGCQGTTAKPHRRYVETH